MAAKKVQRKSQTDPDHLTEMQERFCFFYNETPNACQAAKKAGYKEETACQMGANMLREEKIKKRIAKLKEETYNKLTNNKPFTKEALLDELQYIKVAALDQNNLDTAIKAAASQAKILGLEQSKIDVTSGGEKIIGINYIMPKNNKDE